MGQFFIDSCIKMFKVSSQQQQQQQQQQHVKLIKVISS